MAPAAPCLRPWPPGWEPVTHPARPWRGPPPGCTSPSPTVPTCRWAPVTAPSTTVTGRVAWPAPAWRRRGSPRTACPGTSTPPTNLPPPPNPSRLRSRLPARGPRPCGGQVRHSPARWRATTSSPSWSVERCRTTPSGSTSARTPVTSRTTPRRWPDWRRAPMPSTRRRTGRTRPTAARSRRPSCTAPGWPGNQPSRRAR